MKTQIGAYYGISYREIKITITANGVVLGSTTEQDYGNWSVMKSTLEISLPRLGA